MTLLGRLIGLALALVPVPALAAAPDDAEKSCAALAGQRLDLPDAVTRVDSATIGAGHDGVPDYCDVKATVAPAVGIETRLPIQAWNGKFVEVGRGGFCRPITMEDCDGPLRQGFACLISDQGNKTAKSDDAWANGNLQAKVDCGFRANHVAAIAGKAITQRYYAKAARRAYFMGCSTGGRMAMVEAQRFPLDFDGIIAGAPPLAKFANGMALAWTTLATIDGAGRTLLTVADLDLYHRAVLTGCDGLDGLKDGIVGAAVRCHVDPGVVACRPGAAADCLSPAKVVAIRRMLAGPVDAAGRALYNGAPLPGSEVNWAATFLGSDGKPSIIDQSMTDMFRSMVEPARPAGWSLADLDWASTASERALLGAYYDATDPDLSAFKQAGGKLLIYHGLADQLIMPGSSIAYYETLTRTMGGPAATRDFARMFLVPGLNHCVGGVGATSIDYLSALDDWVERGRAPDALVGAHPKVAPVNRRADNPNLVPALPLAAANVAFSRPVYAYPAETRYAGGDPTRASSFVAATPPAH